MKLLTLARDLQRRKARERHQRFVAEGVRTVEALLDSALPVIGLLTTEELGAEPRGAALLSRAAGQGIPVHELSAKELDSAADTETPQGVLAVAAIPSRTVAGLDTPQPGARFLILDALQDPGNVGTVVRTAAALGVTATIALPGTVDLWNAKVVRSTMGALFTHPAMSATWEETVAFLNAHGVPLWAADTEGMPLDGLAAVPDRLALAVSNEGAGLSASVAEQARQRVAIRMAPGVESLNVAVATGILLYALRPT